MRFRNEYFFLSNFYSVIIHDVDYPEIVYYSVECAFQASKTISPVERRIFSHIKPGNAKRLGRRITLQRDWEFVKIGIMEKYLRQKFSRPDLANRLKAIHCPIIEDNEWHDYFWGMCNGKGRNELGKLLEKIKAEL